jgi:hypothetical protein
MLKTGLLVALITLLLAARADAHNGQVCLPVKATGVGQDLGNFTTTATITSFGLPLGTSAATFTPTGGDATTVTFTGPIVFTTPIGTLTAQVDGSVNLTTGVFVSQSTSVSGTGAFRGVTGDLRFAGTENLATGAFTEAVTGRLCARFRTSGH